MNGIYTMYYTGVAGSGHAVFVMRDGIVAGADAIGGVFDGTYTDAGDGLIDFSVTYTVPPGTSFVTGMIAGRESLEEKIVATLPENMGNGNSIGITTPSGPVNVIFKRLRNIP